MSIGTKIRRLRETNSLSQPELAYRIGISQTTLCNIEANKCKKIDFLLMVRVCQEFNVTFDYFLNDKKTSQTVYAESY